MYVLVKLCVRVCVRASKKRSIVITERSGPTEITQREKQKEKERERNIETIRKTFETNNERKIKKYKGREKD